MIAGLAVIGSLSTARAQCQLQLDPTVWTLVYHDDFNYLDRTEWDTSPNHNTNINDHYGWGTEWYDFNDPSLVTIASVPNSNNNNMLVLTAKRWLDANGNPVDEPGISPDGTARNIHYRSGMVVSKFQGGLNHSKETSYGVWQARIKCPTNTNGWPAFWLFSGPTEIDILDGISPDNVGAPAPALQNNVIDRKFDDKSISPTPILPSCAAKLRGWSAPGQPLSTLFSDDFHEYTIVWTPEKVTFFFDGRETNSIPSTAVVTRDAWPDIMLTMQMLYEGNAGTPSYDPNETSQMYVDWVRVYKPYVTPGPDYGHASAFSGYSVPENKYKTSSEFLNHDITGIAQSSSLVNATAGSITVNPNKAGQVFYQGTDNLLYVAEQIGTTWTVSALPTVSGGDVAGDIVYHQANDLVVYKGSDARLHAVYFDGSSWQHVWLNSSWAARVNAQPGSVAVHSSGRVAYLGQDSQLHYCDADLVYPWAVTNLTNRYGNAAYAAGDVLFDEVGAIIYKGRDDRLQYYWLNNNIYQHSWADDYWNTGDYTVSRTPHSVAYANGTFYYIGRDDKKLHQLVYDGNVATGHYWNPAMLPSASYVYDQTGYPMADRGLSGITINTAGTRLTYVGQDGRLQSLTLSSGNWHHDWIDNYWNTGEYLSFNTFSNANQYSSLATTDVGQSFYCGADQHLRYFNYEPCSKEYSFAQCNNNSLTHGTLNRTALATTPAASMAQSASLSAYPNPTDGTVEVLLPTELRSAPIRFTLYSLMGKVMTEGTLSTKASSLQLDAYPAGVYLLRIQGAEKTYQTKLVKH